MYMWWAIEGLVYELVVRGKISMDLELKGGLIYRLVVRGRVDHY